MSIYVLCLALIFGAAFLLFTQTAVWSRRDTWIRHAAIPAALVAFLMTAGFTIEATGYAKPLWLTWELKGRKAEILGKYFVEGKAIYLMVLIEGDSVPRLVVRPWSTKIAQEIQDGEERMKGHNGQAMEMDMPYDPSLETFEVYRDFPQEARPPKPDNNPPAEVLR